MITLNNSVLAEHEAALVAEVNNLFFLEMEITVEFKTRKNSRYAGVSYNGQKRIEIITNVSHYGSMLDTLFHELGHMHHYWYNREDYNKCTDYGHEVYAENFKCMVLPCTKNALEEESYNRHRNYKGMARKQEYKEYFPELHYAYDGDYHYSNGLYAIHIKTVWIGNGWNGKYMFNVSILFNGVWFHIEKPTKLDTAKKNAIRKLRKLGIDI